ncbi:MAG: hypothetical protein BZY80_04155 [SAR202 cluster bacterium Io17-Chloro-G2]|nr:MAG: hypothetical protein BZY80_04155 [SAR202 cluster bacterium Io17-Chloro-G2]
MSMQLAEMVDSSRQAKDLNRDAINMAMSGEWEQAVQANRTILESSPGQVDVMNRLGKALMELARYQESREILEEVASLAPHNNIVKKNLARLDQLEQQPAAAKQERRSAGNMRIFIEEGGKAGITVLQKPAPGQTVPRVMPGDPVELKFQQNRIFAYTQHDECLGQIGLKLALRLNRLTAAGNKYEAAIIGAGQQGISVILRETFRHPSMRGVCSFPARAKEENRVYVEDDFSKYGTETDIDDEYNAPGDFPGSQDVEYDE